MARRETSVLYRELISAQFEFLPRGTSQIDSIYSAVKTQCAVLCDNGYLCPRELCWWP